MNMYGFLYFERKSIFTVRLSAVGPHRQTYTISSHFEKLLDKIAIIKNTTASNAQREMQFHT